MTTHNSRNAINIRNDNNNRTANKLWTPPKAVMLAKTVKLATAWRVGQQQQDNRNIKASTAEETHNNKDVRNSRLANNSTSIIRDAHSKIWMPKTHVFSLKFVKKSSEWQKIHEEKSKKRVKIPFLSIDFCNSASYQTIGSPM
jgi:hypothetical protein